MLDTNSLFYLHCLNCCFFSECKHKRIFTGTVLAIQLLIFYLQSSIKKVLSSRRNDL